MPVAACPTNMSYARRAKLRKPKMEDALTGALIASVPPGKLGKGKGAPMPFCREGEGGVDYGVYRRPDSTDSYMMAIGDAGRVLSLYPAVALNGGDPGFSMSLAGLGGTMIYPTFDKLPAPSVAWKTVRTAKPMSSTSREGKTQNISLREMN